MAGKKKTDIWPADIFLPRFVPEALFTSSRLHASEQCWNPPRVHLISATLNEIHHTPVETNIYIVQFPG
jgi:hypothetical protein